MKPETVFEEGALVSSVDLRWGGTVSVVFSALAED